LQAGENPSAEVRIDRIAVGADNLRHAISEPGEVARQLLRGRVAVQGAVGCPDAPTAASKPLATGGLG
jgi:hypothetical protein